MVKFEEIPVGGHFRLQEWMDGTEWYDEDGEYRCELGYWDYPIRFKRDSRGFSDGRRYHPTPPDFLVHTL